MSAATRFVIGKCECWSDRKKVSLSEGRVVLSFQGCIPITARLFISIFLDKMRQVVVHFGGRKIERN
jgi:hypothetical protein